MFENYSVMTAEQKAEVKAIHKAIRAGASSREGNLAWGFVRGFPYKRIERTHRENNAPDARLVTYVIASHVPGFAELPANWWKTVPSSLVEAWLANPEGAIPAPVREKKPFVRPKAEVA